MHKKSRDGGMLGLTDFRQGSGVTPDSGNTVLRSGVVRKLPETAGQGARPPRSRLLPKSFAIKMPALGFDTGALSVFLIRSTLPEVTFVYRDVSGPFKTWVYPQTCLALMGLSTLSLTPTRKELCKRNEPITVPGNKCVEVHPRSGARCLLHGEVFTLWKTIAWAATIPLPCCTVMA
jgi:hypothetical protein